MDNNTLFWSKLIPINLLNLFLIQWMLMVLTFNLSTGKPMRETHAIISKETPSSSSGSASASRRFGPQFWGQSEKYIQLCEHVCTHNPVEGKKYCNCLPDDPSIQEPSYSVQDENDPKQSDQTSLSVTLSSPRRPQQQTYRQLPNNNKITNAAQSEQSQQSDQATIQMPQVKYMDANDASQICDYLCLEDATEAIKYCNCQANGVNNLNNNKNNNNNNVNSNNNINNINNQIMASSEQIMASDQHNHHHQQKEVTLADYFKIDPPAERQVCTYLCSESSLSLSNKYCDCKTKKVVQGSFASITATDGNKVKFNPIGKSHHQLIGNKLTTNDNHHHPLAIKTLLDAAVDSNHRKELCSYVCALEPKEAANGHCDCNANSDKNKSPAKELTNSKSTGIITKTSKFNLNPWRSIKKWFG